MEQGVMVLGISLLQKTLMITSFVGVMMVVIEYVNVMTRGTVIRALQGSQWRQLILASLLGAVPGCLGAYAVVALYTHRKVSLGALVATMIATSGDETFVMLALFPGVAIGMTLSLMLIGIAAGWMTDRWIAPRLHLGDAPCCDFDVHEGDACECFPRGNILVSLRHPSPYRVILVLALALFITALASGAIGPASWDWKRVTFLVITGIGLFISLTVPEHFLEEHLWRHVVRRHVPRVFLWTLAALAVLAGLTLSYDLGSLPAGGGWGLMALASLLGLLPESGPHMVFVTMYSEGVVPLSVLVSSSIVQDGHGMLPLLSASKRTFFFVKLINLVTGLIVGAILLLAGQ